MPSRKSADDADVNSSSEADLLALAEAEALEAETAAAAARAKAEVLRLRRAAELAAAEKAAAAEAAADETAADDEAAQPDETDDADEPETAVEAVADGSAAGSSVGRVLRWAAAVIVVLAIGALVTVSTLLVRHHNEVHAQQERTARYESAARQGVVTLMSLDYNKVDDNVNAILDNSTGEFKKDFENAAEDFKKTARVSKAVTEARISSVAVESATDNDAVVLVAAATKVTNANGAKQEPRNWRLSVELAREGDQIKVSKVEFVP